MSKLRPELTGDGKGCTCPDTADSLYMIRDAVRRRDTLIKGALKRDGNVCAIGAFFGDNPTLALKASLIDEVAAYNDSIKTASPKVRRNRVLQWLNWKLKVLASG